MRKTKWIIAALFLAGCSDPGVPDSGKPIQPRDMYEQLSAQDQAMFKAWQADLIKSCDASQAFGEPKASEFGVDQAILMGMTEGSAIIRGDNGEFAVLAVGTEMSGESSSTFERSLNGYNLKAEAKRVGSRCAIFISGKKVYETELAKQISIRMYWDGKANPQNSELTFPLVGDMKDLASVKVKNLGSLIEKMIAKNNSAVDFVRRRLNLKESETKSFFTVGRDSYARYAVVPDADDSLEVWAGADSNEFIADRAFIEGIKTSGELSLKVAYLLNSAFKGQKASESAASLRFSLPLEIKQSGTKWIARATTVEFGGVFEKTNGEVASCVDARIEYGLLSPERTATTVRPYAFEIDNNCGAIGYDDRKDFRLKTGALPVVLAGIEIAPETRYADWDGVLVASVINAVNAGKDIQQALDPQKKTTVVAALASVIDRVMAEFRLHPALKDLNDEVVRMASNWGFKNFNVSDVEIRRIMNAFTNVYPWFTKSCLQLVSDLKRDPAANMAYVDYADSFTLEYKEKTIEAARLATQLKDYQWIGAVFDRIIQVRLSMADLDLAIKAFQDRLEQGDDN